MRLNCSHRFEIVCRHRFHLRLRLLLVVESARLQRVKRLLRTETPRQRSITEHVSAYGMNTEERPFGAVRLNGNEWRPNRSILFLTQDN